jgi:hypothetical protein
MKTGQVRPVTIVDDFLRQLRAFYPCDKPFYQQRRYLIQAITYPARWVPKRGVFLPEADHRAILDEIISGIRKHGNLATVRNFGVYFLDCVQRHFAAPSNAERYYDYAKACAPKLRPMSKPSSTAPGPRLPVRLHRALRRAQPPPVLPRPPPAEIRADSTRPFLNEFPG